MAKKRFDEDNYSPLAPMPSFDWPKNVDVLDISDLRITPIHQQIRLHFEGEAAKVFHGILSFVITQYCVYPVICTLAELERHYPLTDQVEVWRRALYIVGYNV